MCALIALAQGLYVARVLGSGALAVIGVLASALAVVANFLDVRPTDLASKFYYRDREPVAQAGVLQVCILLNAIVGVAVLVIGTAVAFVVSRVALERPPGFEVILAQAIITSLGLISGTPISLLRLSDRLAPIAVYRVGAQVTTTVAVVTGLAANGEVSGYYAGAATAAVALLPIAAVVSVVAWRRAGLDLLARGALRVARSSYFGELRFLVHGSIMGYAKMLHRGADVLIVALVTSDSTTGVYRLARQLTDGLYVVFDAVSLVHGPRLLSLLAESRFVEFRTGARRLVLGALGFTALVELIVLAGLPTLQQSVLGKDFDGLVTPVALLVLPFAVVTGVHIWLWAALIDVGRLQALVTPSVLGALVQVAALVVVLPLLGRSAGWAALAYVLYYVLAYGLALAWVARHHPDLLPPIRVRSRTEP